MLVRPRPMCPRPMCPRPKILGCCIPWTMCPLAILPLTEPSHPYIQFWLSEATPDFQLSRALALWSGGVLCVGRACIRRRGANLINLVRGVGEASQTPHWSIRTRRPTELVPCWTRSRVGTHWSGAQYPRDALIKGRNMLEFLVGDTSVGDTSTLHRFSQAWISCV
jgi:hypothetical protein